MFLLDWAYGPLAAGFVSAFLLAFLGGFLTQESWPGLPVWWTRVSFYRLRSLLVLLPVLSLALAKRYDWSLVYVSHLVFCGALLLMSFIDIDLWVVDRRFSVLMVLLSWWMAIVWMGRTSYVHILGGVVGFLFFHGLSLLSYYLLKKEALGFGDADVLAVIGAFLGVSALPSVIFGASMLGLLFVFFAWLWSIFQYFKNPKNEIKFTRVVPFVPFLALSAMVESLFSGFWLKRILSLVHSLSFIFILAAKNL